VLCYVHDCDLPGGDSPSVGDAPAVPTKLTLSGDVVWHF
jgi:hypothetical protein